MSYPRSNDVAIRLRQPSPQVTGSYTSYNVPAESPEKYIDPSTIIYPFANLNISQENGNPYPMSSISDFASSKTINVDRANTHSIRAKLRDPDENVRDAALTKLEKRIVTMQGKCPATVVDKLRVGVFQLTPQLMNEYLESDGGFDHEFQDGMGCLIDALIADDEMLPDLRLRRWITDINKIGESSAEGMAFQLSNNKNALYVVKTAIDPDEDSLPHEAVVGMGALNKLRNRVPNFMHTYGAFMCSPPVVDENGKLDLWCGDKNNGITYLVLENIHSAMPLSKLAWNLNPDEFLQIYLQILNALNVAYKEFDYTHFDLHADNVLIQVLPYDVNVPFYAPDGRIMYIKTNYLARIIDYGMSHVLLQGQHFGKYGLDTYNVFAEESFPMHDAYKLLLFTYAASLNKSQNGVVVNTRPRSSITSVANTIFDFFNENITAEERIDERFDDPHSDFFQAPTKLKGITLDEFITYLFSKFSFNFMSNTESTDAISTVCGDKCVNWTDFSRRVFDRFKLPETLEDYCQAEAAIFNLSQDKNKDELYKWLNQFDVQKRYAIERTTASDKINNVITKLNSANLEVILSPKFDQNVYLEQLTNLAKIRSEALSVQIWLQYAGCAYNKLSKPKSIESDIALFKESLALIKKSLGFYRDIVKYNVANDKRRLLVDDIDIQILHKLLLSTW